MDDHLPNFYSDLGGALQRAFEKLTDAAVRPGDAFRTMSCATHNPSGFPQVRALTLRGFDAAARELVFFIDNRTPKIDQLKLDNRVELLAYDAEDRIQLRLSGTASIVTGEEQIQAHWEQVPIESRRNYMSDPAPGFIVTSPDLDHPKNDEAAIANFAILLVTISQLDWLYLHRLGNRRAKFVWKDNSDFVSPTDRHWLVP